MSTPIDAETAKVEAVREGLLGFFRAQARDLPWRKTRDPWAIWVSEVMLQQTRVETVIPYWERFLKRFPTPASLAEATEGDVLTLWSGLGYYRRARFLHAGARAVVAQHGGVVPGTHDGLLGLPGVGAYTAGAIGSIAFGLRVPLVDGNVERVLTRVHGLSGDPRATPTKERLWSLAARYAEHPDPGAVNQALMELGATLCLPQNPQCLVCPARAQCVARASGTPERWPEKAPKKAPREEAWAVLVGRVGDAVWLVPSAMGRWEGMLVPPMVKGADKAAARDFFQSAGAKWKGTMRDLGEVVHVLTHAKMTLRVYDVTLTETPSVGGLFTPSSLDDQAMPTMTRRVLEHAGAATPPTRRQAKPSRASARKE